MGHHRSERAVFAPYPYPQGYAALGWQDRLGAVDQRARVQDLLSTEHGRAFVEPDEKGAVVQGEGRVVGYSALPERGVQGLAEPIDHVTVPALNAASVTSVTRTGSAAVSSSARRHAAARIADRGATTAWP